MCDHFAAVMQEDYRCQGSLKKSDVYKTVKGCKKAGGKCCASRNDGTGKVQVAKANENAFCGYCFSGKRVKIPKNAKTSMQ